MFATGLQKVKAKQCFDNERMVHALEGLTRVQGCAEKDTVLHATSEELTGRSIGLGCVKFSVEACARFVVVQSHSFCRTCE